MVENIDLKFFPTTRYQGSKRKILPWIHSKIKSISFESALDVFGGSASVSYLFKAMSKEVTFNDILRFNYLIGKALIENSNVLLNSNDLNKILTKNPNYKYDKFIENTFDEIYYLREENKWLDLITSNIYRLSGYDKSTLDYKKAICYYALFQSSLIKRPFNLFHRKNLNIRISEVPRNFGNKHTWEIPFEDLFHRFSNEANTLIFNSGKKCTALNKSVFDLDSYGYDLVYIDPPYFRKDGSNESSNYKHCYHFLEGLTNYKEWKDLINYESKNLTLKNEISDSDFNKENITEAIEEIIYKFRKSKIVFSYKNGGIPSIDFIIKLFKKIKGNVRTSSRHYIYALNHQNGDAIKNREVLFISE